MRAEDLTTIPPMLRSLGDTKSLNCHQTTTVTVPTGKGRQTDFCLAYAWGSEGSAVTNDWFSVLHRVKILLYTIVKKTSQCLLSQDLSFLLQKPGFQLEMGSSKPNFQACLHQHNHHVACSQAAFTGNWLQLAETCSDLSLLPSVCKAGSEG